MRKTILILLSLLAAIIPATGQATNPGETESLEAAIDKSSVVFDYKRHSTFGFMGDLTFRVKVPQTTTIIVVLRSMPHDRSIIVQDNYLYPIRDLNNYDINSGEEEREITIHNVTWGVYVTFQYHYIKTTTYDSEVVAYSTNRIYTDDYMRPEDLASIKPEAGIDMAEKENTDDIRIIDDNLNISTQNAARVQIYNLQGCELLSHQCRGNFSIPLNTLPSGIQIVRVISQEKTVIKKIIH